MLLDKLEYQQVLQELVQAHKNLDMNWFQHNMTRCKKLSWHWSTMYVYTKRNIYKRAHKKLEHLIKIAPSPYKWGQYIATLDKATKVC